MQVLRCGTWSTPLSTAILRVERVIVVVVVYIVGINTCRGDMTHAVLDGQALVNIPRRTGTCKYTYDGVIYALSRFMRPEGQRRVIGLSPF